MAHKQENNVNFVKGEVVHAETEQIERDEIFSDASSKHVTVVAKSDHGQSFNLLTGSFDKCKRFCESHFWFYIDANNLYWDLDLKDDRDLDFPKDFYSAVMAYSMEDEKDIDSEFVRQNADKLVASRSACLKFSSFEAWVYFESILGEKLTADQVSFLEQNFLPSQINLSHISLVNKMKSSLEEYRKSIADRENKYGIEK